MTTATDRIGAAELAAPEGAVADSMSVAAWTFVSRVTGVLRGIVIASVLGATFFANTYQFTNSLPNLIFYGFLAGSLFSSLLGPALVRRLDQGDTAAAQRLAGGLFGIVALATVAAIPVLVLLAPALLRVAGGLAGGAPADVAADQAGHGELLVLMLMPQVLLYGVVATAAAVMNAQRRFALAAAAPAVENLGIIAVLVLAAVRYPDAAALADPPPGLILLLGLGTTGAVALHAAIQWWGARRAGVVLLPLPGWRDPAVRSLVRAVVPALVQAGLAAAQLLLLLLFANRVAGGVVAVQLALNLFFLPVALGATPVALSLVPRLSRMTAPADRPVFRDTYVRGLAFALFLAVPAATAYACLAGSIARALSYGGFGAGAGDVLLAAAVLGLAVGVVGETAFLVSTYACYALEDRATPLRAMAVQTAVCVVGVAASLLFTGPAMLLALGGALSAGTVTGAVVLVRSLLRRCPPGGEPLLLPLARTLATSLLMIVPALAAAAAIEDHVSFPGVPAVAVLAASVAGLAAYAGWQALLGAREPGWVAGHLGRGRPDPGRRLTPPGLHDRPRLHDRPGLHDRRRGVAAATVRVPERAPAAAIPPPRRPTRAAHVAPVRPVRRSPSGAARRRVVDVALLSVVAAVGAAVAISPPAVGLLLAAAALMAWVSARPAWAAYLLIVLTPLTAGIDRGTLVPALRPNEVLLGLLVAALGARLLLRLRSGAWVMPRPDAVPLALAGLAVASSVLPLLMMVVREREITADDLTHAVVLWKLLAVYAVVRYSVVGERQAARCLNLSLGASAVVCVLGVLQALNLFGVPGLLALVYAPFGIASALAIGRGSSTLSLPAAVADLAILNLALVVGLLVRGGRRRRLLVALAMLFAFGVIAAGEYSSVIGLGVALAVLVLLTGSGRLVAYAVPVAAAGAVLLRPVIENRLAGFQSAYGVPVSWLGRLRNLRTYFWPELASDHNWVFGVRPAARVPAAHEQFGWVWIESGYTWLLWGGGLPLLAAYVIFVAVALWRGWPLARRHPGVAGVAATGVVAAVAANVVLMLLDPHLTYRGAGDALFMTLALMHHREADP